MQIKHLAGLWWKQAPASWCFSKGFSVHGLDGEERKAGHWDDGAEQVLPDLMTSVISLSTGWLSLQPLVLHSGMKTVIKTFAYMNLLAARYLDPACYPSPDFLRLCLIWEFIY